MRIAFVLYERFTALDVIGPHEVLSRLPGTETVFVSDRPGPVRADSGDLSLLATKTYEDVPAPDIVVVSGGPGWADQLGNERLLGWLRKTATAGRYTASVCTGSLLLAATGLLDGRRATTHWLALDLLASRGVEAVPERVVVDGRFVTAAGVSAGIDMGLTLMGEVAGDTYARAVQLGIEYDPRPPYDAGSPEKAPAELVEQVTAHRRAVIGVPGSWAVSAG